MGAKKNPGATSRRSRDPVEGRTTLHTLDAGQPLVAGSPGERPGPSSQAFRGQIPPPIPLAPLDRAAKDAMGEYATSTLNIWHDSINYLRALAVKAQEEGSLGLAIFATKEAGRMSQQYVTQHLGKIMNIEGVIRHQQEVPDWKALPPEVRRAVAEDVAREMMDTEPELA